MAKRITAADIIGLKPKYAAFVIEYLKDFGARRAAEAAGFEADYGHRLLDRPEIKEAINEALRRRLEATDIDAEWVLMEAVDNHCIARQQGNITASNTALNLVAKNVFVDAFAAEKVEMNSDKEIMERLLRGRKRRQQDSDDDDTPSFL